MAQDGREGHRHGLNEENNDNSLELISALQRTLIELSQNPYPHVPNPPDCKKRASVALVLRVRPSFHHPRPRVDAAQKQDQDEDINSRETALERFFQQDWVRHGDPEAIFIKRASREGDRWTGHVALPGGKRDVEDADDQAVAVRETLEEIGLDLKSPHALFVGNLPERVVSYAWGKVPIMVLCPFVFLWTEPGLPPLQLQPAEVASTHWVSLRVLLSPQTRTFEYVDISDRFARRGGPLLKKMLRTLLGKMRFSAIQLIPSESLFCSSTDEFLPPEGASATVSWRGRLYSWTQGGETNDSAATRPLLLWGLTLSMLADFLDQLPPHNAVQLWSYPTFTTWDVRWVINTLTRSLKRRNETRLQRDGINQTAVDSETQAVATSGNPRFLGGLSDGTEPSTQGKNASRSYAVGIMLEGYYDMARKGIWVAASVRLISTAALTILFIRRLRNSSN
ncbi:hypothetical protein HYALB_00012815 [Hymenoscyphus albidus]|uniref:Nudix hydrolase domain-containing protein n=1 Tax=Hymenoscyphus albidus TaxID=595503 RepID=A0A9N9LVI3_9HELO|nr:hypothetical protein HYALB_00012815 [Hymenoscyphus albidus]